MSVITFYAVFINLSAFINPVSATLGRSMNESDWELLTFSQFFIAVWQETSGWTMTFASQGIIVLFGGLVLYGSLHMFGGKLREKTSQPTWVNAEFDASI